MKNTAMECTSVVEHRGKQILVFDMSGLETVDQAYEVMKEIRDVIGSTGRTDLLTLTNVEGSVDNWQVISALRGLLRHNKRFVTAGAVVGLTPFKRGLFDMLMAATGRKMAAFDDVEKAKDWLVDASA
jgi:hypothetical protein